jgi:NAD(P)-dependent dehydrogenase (short-subunit alcohol dehydrogenase family)
MAGRFEGKSVFVAGASSGINLGIARAFAREGARLTVLSRSADKIEAAAAELRGLGAEAIGVACDVRDYPGLEAAFARSAEAHGGVDIDLLGTFNVFRASFEHLRRPGASLVAITAGQAVRPMPFQIHACAAKAGVNMVTKCLALEWGPAGVRVNAISPGPIADTEGMARLAADPAREADIKARLALRDYGTKDDIAEAAMYLSSETAKYVTGTILNVDGGGDLGDASADALGIAR